MGGGGLSLREVKCRTTHQAPAPILACFLNGDNGLGDFIEGGVFFKGTSRGFLAEFTTWDLGPGPYTIYTAMAMGHGGFGPIGRAPLRPAP